MLIEPLRRELLRMLLRLTLQEPRELRDFEAEPLRYDQSDGLAQLLFVAADRLRIVPEEPSAVAAFAVSRRRRAPTSRPVGGASPASTKRNRPVSLS